MRGFSLMAVVGLLTVSPVAAQTAGTPLPVVVAEGQATVKRAPDRAWISIATETRDIRPAEARRKNAEAMTTVQDVLKGVGIASGAMRTTAFSLLPDGVEGRPRHAKRLRRAQPD